MTATVQAKSNFIFWVSSADNAILITPAGLQQQSIGWQCTFDTLYVKSLTKHLCFSSYLCFHAGTLVLFQAGKDYSRWLVGTSVVSTKCFPPLLILS